MDAGTAAFTSICLVRVPRIQFPNVACLEGRGNRDDTEHGIASSDKMAQNLQAIYGSYVAAPKPTIVTAGFLTSPRNDSPLCPSAGVCFVGENNTNLELLNWLLAFYHPAAEGGGTVPPCKLVNLNA